MALEPVTWKRKAADFSLNALYLVGALGCFALAVYSILLDRAGSAGVAATFAVAFVFLRHLPIIESFKAFNMEAKFASRVSDADRLLSQIRSAAQVTSRLLYMQLAYLDRMTTMGWGRKREFMQQLDTHLQELGVDADFIDRAKLPLLNFASWDLYTIFVGSARTVATRLKKEIAKEQQEIQKKGPIPAADVRWNELHQESMALQHPELNFKDVGDMSGTTKLKDMTSLTRPVLEAVAWPERDARLLELIATEVEDLSKACWEQGTVTAETQAYLEKYGNKQDNRLAELEALNNE